MSKYNISKFVLLLLVIVIGGACNSGKKAGTETKTEEVIPENVVEMRDDQIKLAGIQTSLIEKKSLRGTLKVNGLVCAAPQNLATF